MPEEQFFELKDCRGNKIVCTNTAWENHIYPDHYDVDLKQVKETLLRPDHINADPKHPDTEVYYRRFGREMMRVVVRVGVNEYSVVTAFFSNPKPREKRIWNQA